MHLRARKQLRPPTHAHARTEPNQAAPGASASASVKPTLHDDLKAHATPESAPKLAPRISASSDSPPPTMCHPGCLRAAGHLGLCLTSDGLAPPSIKRKHRAYKLQHCQRIAVDSLLLSIVENVDDDVDVQTVKRLKL
jgi:hypothetical protein